VHQDELTLQIVGKINYILNALIDKGLIKAENFATAKQKKKYKYLLNNLKLHFTKISNIE
jgi:hypothetical protein